MKTEKLRNLLELVVNSTRLSRRNVAVDVNHTILLFGLLISAKPKTVLGVGIGSGLVTRTILSALRYNGVGSLTSVDN